MLNKIMEARYLKIKWNGWNYVASPIESKKELRMWLDDGSLEEGDTIILIREIFRVTKAKDRLYVTEFKKEDVSGATRETQRRNQPT